MIITLFVKEHVVNGIPFVHHLAEFMSVKKRLTLCGRIRLQGHKTYTSSLLISVSLLLLEDKVKMMEIK